MPREARRDRRHEAKRRVCFVTGTRAEFGLMQSTLAALRDDPRIELQLIATGSHVQGSRATLKEIRRGDWTVDATVPWAVDTTPAGIARAMGRATAALADKFEFLRSDVVLVVGDRVEAFAAATAAHVSGRIVAHVHGGDRAIGQVDDSLRHAISKLAHVHFAATRESGERLYKLGEDRKRIHIVGAPGIDGIRDQGRSVEFQRVIERRKSRVGDSGDAALLLLHPTLASDSQDAALAKRLVDATRVVFGQQIIALAPNNDPGSAGIHRELRRRAKRGELTLIEHLARADFLAALLECRALIGNSSSGIIEAGSFGTPVLDVGPRQHGRQRGANVRHVDWDADLLAAVRNIATQKRTRPADNPYGAGGAGKRIAAVLSKLTIDDALRRKLIRY